MTYICKECGAVFHDPVPTKESFSHSFGVESYEVLTCPHCASERIIIATPCESRGCDGWTPWDRRLCRQCKEELKARVVTFFDALSPAEEEQVEAWIEAAAIADRKEWPTDDR